MVIRLDVEKLSKGVEKLVEMKARQKMELIRPRICAKLKLWLDKIAAAEALGVDLKEIRETILSLAVQFRCIEEKQEVSG